MMMMMIIITMDWLRNPWGIH
jgi:hypothetical protein